MVCRTLVSAKADLEHIFPLLTVTAYSYNVYTKSIIYMGMQINVFSQQITLYLLHILYILHEYIIYHDVQTVKNLRLIIILVDKTHIFIS